MKYKLTEDAMIRTQRTSPKIIASKKKILFIHQVNKMMTLKIATLDIC